MSEKGSVISSNSKLHTVRYITFLLIPVLVAFAFHPLWLISFKGTVGTGTAVAVALLTMALNTVFTPLYLIVIIGFFALKRNLVLSLGIVISFVSLHLSIYLQFWNWGVATGGLNNPDSSTSMVFLIERVVSSIILLVGMISLYITKSRKNSS